MKILTYEVEGRQKIGIWNHDENWIYPLDSFGMEYSHMQEVIDLEDRVDVREKEMQRAHVQRLTKGECSPEAGMIFSDIASGLERVADHATNIAFAVITADED